MKRFFALLVLFLFLTAVALPIAVHATIITSTTGSTSFHNHSNNCLEGYNRMETESAKTEPLEKTVSQDVSNSYDDTLILVNTVLDKLITEKCSFAGYRGATYAEEYLSYVYFVPELKELEKADDAGLALIELYEAQIPVLKEKYASVLAHAYEMSQNDPEHFALTAEESHVYRTYRNIEALLSIEVYASKLTDEQKLRFEADCEIVKEIIENAEACVFDLSKTGSITNSKTFDIISSKGPGDDITYSANGYVYTTSGTAVLAFKPSRQLTYAERVQMINDDLNDFPGIVKKSEPSANYNCHSYAWYSNGANYKWLMDVAVLSYKNDAHTTAISASSIQPGDIVVYKSNWSNNAHSGIIISVSSGNIIVQSKWGQSCTWRHALSNVPNDYKYNGSVSVTYYRYTRTHTYVQATYISPSAHRLICSICGYNQETEHHTPNAYGVCTKCGYNGPMIDSIHFSPAITCGRFKLELQNYSR